MRVGVRSATQWTAGREAATVVAMETVTTEWVDKRPRRDGRREAPVDQSPGAEPGWNEAEYLDYRFEHRRHRGQAGVDSCRRPRLGSLRGPRRLIRSQAPGVRRHDPGRDER